MLCRQIERLQRIRPQSQVPARANASLAVPGVVADATYHRRARRLGLHEYQFRRSDGLRLVTDPEPSHRLLLGDHDPNQRGFTLATSEFAMQGAVDPYFSGFANIVFKLDRHTRNRSRA